MPFVASTACAKELAQVAEVNSTDRSLKAGENVVKLTTLGGRLMESVGHIRVPVV